MCQFIIAWVGKCDIPQEPFCSKHSEQKCKVCGEQATKDCGVAGSLVCGAPLCSDQVCEKSHMRRHYSR